MRTSIVISVHNEGDRLRKTIESCIETSIALDYEIVVADDASTDGSTEEVARRFPLARLVRHERRQGVSPTRALGARHARGEVLLFLDGHTKPEHGAVARLVQAVEGLEGGAVVTPKIAALDTRHWKCDFSQIGAGYHLDLETFNCGWRGLDQLRPVEAGGKRFYESPALIGCAFAVGRSLYDKLWGFDPAMRSWGVEDLDFSLKCWLMGHRVLHDPEAVVGHRFRAKFDNFSVPPEHVLVNQLRMARKNFIDTVWGDWLDRCRLRHPDRLPDHPEGLFARAYHLFETSRDSVEQERSYLHARRVRDEFWYAERFGQAWPRLQTSAAPQAAARTQFVVHASPGPSGPPPSCKVTGINPATATLFLGLPNQFTAQGTLLGGVSWNAPGATPATGSGPRFTTKWTTTGVKTVTASCGGTTKNASVRVLAVEVQINNTPASNDDVVQVQCLHPARRPTVPCRIRVLGPAASAVNVVLTNPDGRLRFPNAGNTTMSLALAANNAFTAFSISGETASAAKGDAKIEARLNSAAGAVVGGAAVTVFTFSNAQMLLTQGGNYTLVGNNYTVAGGVAVSFSSKAQLVPAGLDCAAPQIANLRDAIMQESHNFIITTTWNTPTVAWAAATPSGTSINVPTTMGQTTTYAPTVVQPVNDGLAGASPLYSKAAAALKPPLGCAGGGAATSDDTPGQQAPPTLSLPITSGTTVVATVTWTNRVNTTRVENFRTFCVVFDNVTQTLCSLREAIWTLNADSSAANQHANVNPDSAASANPATGVQANNAPTATANAPVGPATTPFVKP